MQTSRLSIVDLAGSERTKNTGNTGQSRPSTFSASSVSADSCLPTKASD